MTPDPYIPQPRGRSMSRWSARSARAGAPARGNGSRRRRRCRHGRARARAVPGHDCHRPHRRTQGLRARNRACRPSGPGWSDSHATSLSLVPSRASSGKLLMIAPRFSDFPRDTCRFGTTVAGPARHQAPRPELPHRRLDIRRDIFRRIARLIFARGRGSSAPSPRARTTPAAGARPGRGRAPRSRGAGSRRRPSPSSATRTAASPGPPPVRTARCHGATGCPGASRSR
jgi:hypothetical protein